MLLQHIYELTVAFHDRLQFCFWMQTKIKTLESKCYNRTENTAQQQQQQKNTTKRKSFDKYRETHKNRKLNATEQQNYFINCKLIRTIQF